MRHIIPLLVILLIVLVGIGSIFILQFDPNQFRPNLEAYFEKQMGVEPRLGNLSVKWGPALSLQIGFLEIREPAKHALLLKADRVTIGVDWASFLQRKILIKSLTAEHPELFLFRKADRSWSWPQSVLSFRTRPAHEAAKTVLKPWPLELKMSSMNLQNGTVHFHDESSRRQPFSFKATQVAAKVSRPKPDAPVQANILANFEANTRNQAHLNLIYYPSDDRLTFQARYGQDIFFSEGQIQSISKTPRVEMRVTVHKLELSSIIPAAWKNQPYLTGQLEADLEGVGIGRNRESLGQTMLAKGIVDIQQGSLANINLLKETFRKMAEIPQLHSLRRLQIPPDFVNSLEGHDTLFDILQGVIHIRQGVLEIRELRLKHPHYLMEAAGSYGLEDRLCQLNAKLVILEELSQFLLSQVNALDVVKNPQERLVIPLIYQGSFPEAEIQPDFRYLMDKLRKKKGGDEEEEEEEEKDEDG